MGAFALGTLIGLYVPGLAPFLFRFGHLYVTFLVMCVPPVTPTALSSSLARWLTHESAAAHLRRLVIGAATDVGVSGQMPAK